jgi:hypothetical protein
MFSVPPFRLPSFLVQVGWLSTAVPLVHETIEERATSLEDRCEVSSELFFLDNQVVL